MKKFYRALLGLAAAAAAAGVMAQDSLDLNVRLTATGNLVANPNPVVVTDPNGIVMVRTITVTNTGVGNAANLSVGAPQRVMGSLGQLYLNEGPNTCSTATLAPGGTCHFQMNFDGVCPKPETSKWNVPVTSTTAPTLNISVTLASSGHLCE